MRIAAPALAAFAVALLASSPVFAAPTVDDVAGTWQTIDDETKKPKSHVEISISGGKATGKILELINPSSPNPKCTECDGAKKDKPIVGLEIMWDLKPKKGEDQPTWEDGKIMDPKNGKTYDCKIWLKDMNTLIVRGSWLMFGREQTWHRLEPKA